MNDNDIYDVDENIEVINFYLISLIITVLIRVVMLIAVM